MTISGFTFIRNGLKFDYPFLESIRSLLPLVDELIIAVGDSSDKTREAIDTLASNKIRIIDTQWDDSLRSGGAILAQQTDIALNAIRGDWGFYLQGDEVIHEDDVHIIKTALDYYAQDVRIEGLLFDYLHFYGAYNTIGDSRKWYRREIRVIRNGKGIRSWGDAQGFRKRGEKIQVAHIPARIFHYGWVKKPASQSEKLKSFHRFWHSDTWVEENVKASDEFRYDEGGQLKEFDGTHPAVMAERIKNSDLEIDRSASTRNIAFRDKVLNTLESITGWRPGEYKNYTIIETFSKTS